MRWPKLLPFLHDEYSLDLGNARAFVPRSHIPSTTIAQTWLACRARHPYTLNHPFDKQTNKQTTNSIQRSPANTNPPPIISPQLRLHGFLTKTIRFIQPRFDTPFQPTCINIAINQPAFNHSIPPPIHPKKGKTISIFASPVSVSLTSQNSTAPGLFKKKKKKNSSSIPHT